MFPASPEFSAAVSLFAASVAALSALIAIFSVVVTRKNWKDSNRPVVTAYIDEESGAEGITVFNPYLKNTGTRPAASIHLFARSSDIQRIISAQAEAKRRRHIEVVFTKESLVTVLHPDETLVTSFGLASTDPSQQWLEYGMEMQIEISYRDLEGRKYKSRLPLRTRPREGFGGGVWKSAA
jgi:hypothetical protein